MQTGAPAPTGWPLGYVADIATLVGLAATIIGFVVTIVNVVRSRSAAERAEKAARAARSNLLRVDSVAVVSGVISELEEIKRMHRAGAWDGIPAKYAVQRRHLVSVRAASHPLTDAQKTALQSAIQQLSAMEKSVEEHLSSPGSPPPDRARLNSILSKQADSLTQLLTELKIDEGHHGE